MVSLCVDIMKSDIMEELSDCDLMDELKNRSALKPLRARATLGNLLGMNSNASKEEIINK